MKVGGTTMPARRRRPMSLRALGVAVAVVVVAHGTVTTTPHGTSLALLPVAHAEDDSAPSSARKGRKVPNMQESTYRRLGEAQELVEAEEYGKALPMLEQMLESKRRYNNNERAQIHKMLAYIYFEMEDNAKTIHHFEQVIAQVPDITEGLENSTLETLARLYFQEAMNQDNPDSPAANQWFQKTLRTIDDWMSKVDEVGPDAHQFVATVHFQMGNKTKSIDHMETAVRLAQERGTKVKEQWWQMLQALYADADNWQRVVEIGEVLVKNYPKRTNWMTLAGAYGQIDQPQKQLWTLEAAHAGGYLENESDFYTYAGLLLQSEMPNRASKYLQLSMDEKQVERTVKNLQLLGQAYQAGRDIDEAIPVFEEAGKLAEDGATLSRLAALYLQRDEYEKCRDTAERAIKKGGLRRPLSTRVTLGTCLFNMRMFSKARQTFVEIRRDARGNENARTEQRMARDWIRYIENERKRAAELAKLSG